MGNQKSIPERGLTYEKLDTDRNQIRLLKFQKRRRKDPQHLNISLHTVSLSERPRYHCISYFWGDPSFIWPIYVNGVLTHVTPNLGAALSCLEHEEVEALWVDGICINQRDMEERVDQVKKMSQIYSGCVANFAWLGLGDKESSRAMHAINTIGARLFRILMVAYVDKLLNQLGEEIEDDPRFSAAIEIRETLRLDGDSDTRDPFKLTSEFLSRDDIAWMLDHLDELINKSNYSLRDELFPATRADFTEALSAWRNIMDRPLWKRIWIVQELVLPEVVILKCGSKSARLDFLHAIYRLTQEAMHIKYKENLPEERAMGENTADLDECFTSPESSLQIVATTRQNMFSTRNAVESWDTIHVMLQQCGLLKSTNPLDKVYGLMSISTDLEGLQHLVDYDKPIRQLMMEVMKLTLLRHGMRHIQEGQWFQYPGFPASPYLPSWNNVAEAIYPSGSTVGPLYLLHKGRPEIAYKQFEASKSYSYELSHLNFPSPDVLRIPCRIIGNVERVCNLSTRTWSRDEADYEVAQMAMARSIIAETEHFFALEKDLDRALHGKPLWWLFNLQSDVPSNPKALSFWQGNMEGYRKQFFVLKEGGVDPSNCMANRAAIIRWIDAYSPFTVDTGYIGLGPWQILADDKVVIFPDVDVPYVLRPVGNGCHKILGQAYILGIMNGEYLEDCPPETMIDLL